ncbi:hypothetical protein HDV02_002452 [Globomyces sp. JEL0801]|nr:hypothetical protein HDV02_002452 [Globomyces sp. JEL0801]
MSPTEKLSKSQIQRYQSIMTAQQTVFVTGANRGIGLEFVRYYVTKGYKVIGGTRSPYSKCPELAKLIPIDNHVTLDTSSEESIATLPTQFETLKISKLDILINNAGIFIQDGVEENNIRASALQQFQVNTLGPISTTLALLDFLKPGSKVISISSEMASIAGNQGSYYGYRMSKASLNMAMKGLSVDLKDTNVLFLALDPGFTKTDMTSGHGEMGPDETVARMVKVIEKLDASMSGAYYQRDGHQLPY